MDVESIRMLVTLKHGETVWKKGLVLVAPFPAAIAEEIRAVLSKKVVPPTIEVVSRKGLTQAPEKPIGAKKETIPPIVSSPPEKQADSVSNEKQKPRRKVN